MQIRHLGPKSFVFVSAANSDTDFFITLHNPMEVDHASRVVLPGDVIHEATNNEQQGVITLGPGLRQEGEHIVATKAGMLKHAAPMRWWIESNQKRVCLLNCYSRVTLT